MSVRAVTPGLFDIAHHWWSDSSRRGLLPESAAFKTTDLGEPGCFRCGWLTPTPDVGEVRRDHPAWPSETVFRRTWKLAGRYLDKAHLVDHALTQDDSLDNLVLLCHYPCHARMGRRQYTTRSEALGWINEDAPSRDAVMFFQLLTGHWNVERIEHGIPTPGRARLRGVWELATEAALKVAEAAA